MIILLIIIIITIGTIIIIFYIDIIILIIKISIITVCVSTCFCCEQHFPGSCEGFLCLFKGVSGVYNGSL